MWSDINFNFSLLTTSFTASETMSKLSYVCTYNMVYVHEPNLWHFCTSSPQPFRKCLFSFSKFHSEWEQSAIYTEAIWTHCISGLCLYLHCNFNGPYCTSATINIYIYNFVEA